jgi:uncharacterized membrane protein
MQTEVWVEIGAPAERVWGVMSDVEKWAEWTASIQSVVRLESGAFGVSSQARVRQPKFPPLVWRVTRYDPGYGFVWETRSWGAVTVGEHWITKLAEDRSKVVLRIRQTGLVGSVVGALIQKLTRSYMEMEAQGLKRRVESAHSLFRRE